MDEILRLKDLSFRYEEEKAWALKEVSLSISSGEKIAVLGNNGAGKSTFFRCCNGILRPKEGSLYLNQGAVLFIISAIVNILDEHGFFGISLFHLIDFGIFGLVLDLLNLILFIMMIIGIVSACRGTKVELPMIGQIRLVK